ncbi:hypothetical protein L3Q82_012289 [Xyrichtys novacula]|uniref:Retrotransposon gag domain-containing protein n=1 Tax=Xyrichtys novacula TaxID=13765 RepID=A0AAV1HNV5_XYRNO|nr:hypothetical protein L3Q82_012289 [Xyrichtys novacula]
MESARLDQIKDALVSHGTLLGQHDSLLKGVTGTLEEMTRQMQQISAQLIEARGPPATAVSAAPASPPAALPPDSVHFKEPFVSHPEPFSGDFGSCSRFLFNCSLVFKLQPYSYASDEAKIAYTINLLRGKAAKWATALWEGGSSVLNSFETFSAQLRRVFDHPVLGQDAAKQLLALSQGGQSVASFAVDFQILAGRCGWDEAALKALFVKGLSEELKDELATRDEPDSLQELFDLAIKIDGRLRERDRERAASAPRQTPPSGHVVSTARPTLGQLTPPAPTPPATAPPADSEEPMQLGKTRLSLRERRRQRVENLCLYCGGAEHSLQSCPLLLKDRTHH